MHGMLLHDQVIVDDSYHTNQVPLVLHTLWILLNIEYITDVSTLSGQLYVAENMI